jgi:Threonine dehydrogenase and related Zn-dependent dehydrogenases
MKAVVKEKKGIGNVIYTDIPEPQPKKGEIKVEVKAAGVCGTDLHILHDGFRYNPPVVLGHEFAGVVVALGEGVTSFKVGDRVTAEAPAHLCETCAFCRVGQYNLCSNRSGLGWGVNGCFAKYTIVEEKLTHKIPDTVSFKGGAVIEPLACVIHAIELTEVSADQTVLIAGPGPIGLLMLQGVKAEGARVVMAGTSIDKDRLALAKKLGADYTVNVQEQDLAGFVRGLTNSYGADVVFECSGNERSVDGCLEAIKKGGKYTQMGLFGKRIGIDIDKVVVKEIHIVGVQSQRWTSWERALKLLAAGKISLEPVVSGEYSLADWEKAFAAFESKQGLKIVMYPEN